MAFIIWCIVAGCMEVLGIVSLFSEKPVGFWANVKGRPRVTDVKAYNRAMFRLWTGFAVYLLIAGLPLIGIQQNSPRALISMLMTPPGCIALAVIYMLKIENKYVIR